MIAKTIKFDNLDGEEISDVFYFHITKLEALELEVRFPEGLEGHLKKIGNTSNAQEAYDLFKDVLVEAYGEKAPDNIRFIKSPEIKSRFADSAALGELIFEFLNNPEYAADFLQECLPARIVKEAKAEAAKNASGQNSPGGTPELTPATPILDTERSIDIATEIRGTETLKEKNKRLKKMDATQIESLAESELDDFEDTVKTRNMTPEQLRAVFKRREQLRAE